MSQMRVGKQVCVLGERYQERGESHDYIRDERLQAQEAIIAALGKADLVDVPCLCGKEPNDRLLATIDRFALPVSAVLCQHCGLIRLSPRWEDATYITIYQNYFWPLQMGSFGVTPERFQLSVSRAQGFVDVISARLDLQGLKVVEIGCSYGAGLFALKDSGANLVGYDYDERILELGKGFTGLDLRPGGLEAALKHNEKYDLVILRHVFEHFLEPMVDGASLRRLLTKKGKVFIEVPGVLNAKEWSPDPLMVFNAFHTYYYSLKTLSNVMHSCGFVGEESNDEAIYSIWSVGSLEQKTSWGDGPDATSVMDFLLEREACRERDSQETFGGRILKKAQGLFPFLAR